MHRRIFEASVATTGASRVEGLCRANWLGRLCAWSSFPISALEGPPRANAALCLLQRRSFETPLPRRPSKTSSSSQPAAGSAGTFASHELSPANNACKQPPTPCFCPHLATATCFTAADGMYDVDVEHSINHTNNFSEKGDFIMPGGDGTGPMGMGPMTGRGAGFCGGSGVPGFASRGPGLGFGRGRGGREADEDGETCFTPPV